MSNRFAAVFGASIFLAGGGAAQAQTSPFGLGQTQTTGANAAATLSTPAVSSSPAITLTPPTSNVAVQIPTLSAPAAGQSFTPPPPPALSAQDFITAADGTVAQVYGSQLFTGAFSAARPTKQSSYLIQPGDQIAVRIFGAVNVDAVQTVDTSGDLFIQGVGPVKVGNAPVSQLQSTVETALRNVYTTTVGVYLDVLQGGTLGVYLTGDVLRPGRYLGTTGDSLLYFLDQAGGIDPSKGSFRAVSVLRNGRIVATYDLYDFMTKGHIAPFAFAEGDVVYVGQRGPMVAVTGDAVNGFAFEAPAGSKTLSGAEILRLARPQSTVTSVGVTSVQNGSGFAHYYPIDQFARVPLIAGDHVLLRSEVYTETISVSIQGDLKGPSLFVLPRDALLSQLLAKIPLAGTDVEPTYVHIQRASVAASEKVALDKALDDLQKAILTTPTLSASSTTSVSTQSQQFAQFVQIAKQTQPAGTVAVYVDGKFNDLHLENGDVVIFPKKSDVVIVAGEILSPGAFAHADDLTAADYIRRAGGYSPNANHHHVVLQRPDGTALVVSPNSKTRPGDEIVVIPEILNRNFLLFTDLTTVVFQMVTSLAAVIAISK